MDGPWLLYIDYARIDIDDGVDNNINGDVDVGYNRIAEVRNLILEFCPDGRYGPPYPGLFDLTSASRMPICSFEISSKIYVNLPYCLAD